MLFTTGVLAHIIASIIEGTNIYDAVNQSIRVLKEHEGHEECSIALANAF